MALKFPEKDPDEVLEYTMDWTGWTPTGDDIQSAGTSVTLDGTSAPNELTDLTIDSVVVGSDLVTAWLSGGTVGETYTLKYEVVDNNNPVRTGVRRATIKIKEK